MPEELATIGGRLKAWAVSAPDAGLGFSSTPADDDPAGGVAGAEKTAGGEAGGTNAGGRLAGAGLAVWGAGAGWAGVATVRTGSTGAAEETACAAGGGTLAGAGVRGAWGVGNAAGVADGAGSRVFSAWVEPDSGEAGAENNGGGGVAGAEKTTGGPAGAEKTTGGEAGGTNAGGTLEGTALEAWGTGVGWAGVAAVVTGGMGAAGEAAGVA